MGPRFFPGFNTNCESGGDTICNAGFGEAVSEVARSDLSGLPPQARSEADTRAVLGRKRGKQPIFVVQRHDARRLHYDFRLERDDALASWAVPKGVPSNRGSAPSPSTWKTTHSPTPPSKVRFRRGLRGRDGGDLGQRHVRARRGEARRGLTVHLHGKRLEGLWTLIPAKLDGDPKNWLILKKHDETAPGKTQVRYEPMLATLVQDPGPRRGWLFEVKWDGYRALAYVKAGEGVKLSAATATTRPSASRCRERAAAGA